MKVMRGCYYVDFCLKRGRLLPHNLIAPQHINVLFFSPERKTSLNHITNFVLECDINIINICISHTLNITGSMLDRLYSIV